MGDCVPGVRTGMEYAALTFWLIVIVLAAMGVHQLWSSLVQPRIVNSLLLPGTLVAQLGHVVGLLITGGTVNDTSLVKDDDSGEPQTGSDTHSRIPIVGPIVIALLPLVGCAVAIYWVAYYFDSPILARMDTSVSTEAIGLPTTIPLMFQAMRQSLTLVEQFLETMRTSDLSNWKTLLFLYLVICLTVRMAPFTGNLKGSLGAILLFGVIAFLIGQLTSNTAAWLRSAWPLVNFCAAVSLFLLLFSLLLKGTVCLAKTLFGGK